MLVAVPQRPGSSQLLFALPTAMIVAALTIVTMQSDFSAFRNPPPQERGTRVATALRRNPLLAGVGDGDTASVTASFPASVAASSQAPPLTPGCINVKMVWQNSTGGAYTGNGQVVYLKALVGSSSSVYPTGATVSYVYFRNLAAGTYAVSQNTAVANPYWNQISITPSANAVVTNNSVCPELTLTMRARPPTYTLYVTPTNNTITRDANGQVSMTAHIYNASPTNATNVVWSIAFPSSMTTLSGQTSLTFTEPTFNMFDQVARSITLKLKTPYPAVGSVLNVNAKGPGGTPVATMQVTVVEPPPPPPPLPGCVTIQVIKP